MAKGKQTKSSKEKQKGATSVVAATAMPLGDLVIYQPGSVVSRVLAKNPGASLTAFALDSGQAITEHSSPLDAYVIVADGGLELTIGGEHVTAEVGDVVLMPAGVPHAVLAKQAAKMLLVTIKSAG